MKRLNEKVAIVTGAGSGFGKGIASLFAREGAKVVVADLNGDTARQTVAEIEAAGGCATAAVANVADNASVKGMIEAAISAYGKIDILVNNAGTTHKNGPLLEVDEATFDRVYAVNVKSLYLTAQHIVPHFRQQGSGCIINIASTAGVRPRPGLTWYNGSKGAAIILTKSMAVELAPDKIRVNAVNPVMGETGLLDKFLPGEDSEASRAKVIATIPLGRLSKPDDIAKATLFFASADADFITGVCMEVDGGRCI